MYFATNNRWTGFKYAFISGLTEPLAVVLQGMILHVRMSNNMVEFMLSAVAGIMVFIAIHELVPLSLEHAGRNLCSWAIFGGMALMAGNLHLMDMYFEGH